jgi:hypothetical protein
MVSYLVFKLGHSKTERGREKIKKAEIGMVSLYSPHLKDPELIGGRKAQ